MGRTSGDCCRLSTFYSTFKLPGTRQVTTGTVLRHFSSTPGTSVFHAPHTEEELAMVRQAHLEGRSRADVIDLVTTADRLRPRMDQLFKRAFSESIYSREHVTLRVLPQARRWTLAEVEAIKKAYAARKTFRSIAEALGRTTASVSNRVQRIVSHRISRQFATSFAVSLPYMLLYPINILTNAKRLLAELVMLQNELSRHSNLYLFKKV